MSDRFGPPREPGMFAKEAYLHAEPIRSPVRAAALRDQAYNIEFAEAVSGELAMAYRLAGYILADAVEAQDAVQEASVRSWRGWPNLREREKFHSWFSQILVNVCRTRLRQRARHRTVDIEDADVESGDPFRAALARDTIGRALSALSPELRIVVVLRYWGELSLAEIADRLRIPIGTVKSRHHAALQTLRRRIESAEGGIR
jgi:RNA polymerase sigma-70 factor (ECF subfamily)